MTVNFRTEFDQMRASASHVAEIADGIAGELRILDARIAQMEPLWTGATAMKYMALHQRWLDAATRLRTTLAEISSGIATNANQLEANERAIGESVDRTASQFG